MIPAILRNPAPFAALATLLALASSGMTQDRPWTIGDLVGAERVSDWSLDASGQRALWLRWRPDPEKDRQVPTLMLTLLDSGEHLELTVGPDSIGAPAFSPDGRRIAFLSDRKFPDGVKGPADDERGSQIWMLDLRGGAPRPITKIPHGVRGFVWHDDDHLLLLARERLTRRELEAKENKDKTRVVEDETAFRDGVVRLFRFTIDGAKLRRLDDDLDPIESFSASPDGRRVIATHATSPSHTAQGHSPPRLLLHDLESGTRRELFADTANKGYGFVWSPDGERAWCRQPVSTEDGEAWGAVVEVRELSFGDDEVVVRRVDLGTDRGLDGTLAARPDGFVAALADGARSVFARFVRGADGGYTRTDLTHPFEVPLQDLELAPDADVALVSTSDASTPDTVHLARLTGAEIVAQKQLYRPNNGFAGIRHARSEVITFAGAGGAPIEAILHHPLDRRDGERAPLVLITHGGPHAHDQDRWAERWANSPNLYAARGAFVLRVNYHGSSGYGLEFGESIRERYYELELIDLFSGIRHLDEQGLIDTDRMGLVGWSNGAILTIAALTHADELAPGFDYTFRAAAPGAGDVNWTSDYGNCAFGAAFDEFYVGGRPWTNPEGYVAKSPLFRMDRVTTPTIIFFGSDDRAVPTEQGWQHFRALNEIGKVPVRFLLFPGEGHGLTKLSHQRRKLEEELAWFDRHLFGKPPERTPVKPGSPLEVAEILAAVPQHRAAYGELVDDTLLPEVVPVRLAEHRILHIGRFEVTRAQWRAFRPDDVSAADPNHPITDVPPEEVTAYLQWLGQRTGATWRLPTAAEFDELPTGSAENTLERWAGYAPNPREAADLATRLTQLGADRALTPVGTHPPAIQGEGPDRVMLFDIGGNAAEWITTDAGPRPRGGSAIRANDDRAEPATTLPAAFVGFRVVRVDG